MFGAASNDGSQPVTSPLLSIAVCSKNRPPRLVESCLSYIHRSASGVAVEIVLVDGNQTPTLKQLAFKSGARYVHEARSGMSIARNAGVRAATTRIIAFTDDDCEVKSDWVGRILKMFAEDQELTVLGGLDLTPKDSSFFQKSIGLLDDLRGIPRGGPGLARRIINCNVAYLRKALLDYGGYDETFQACEDQELHLRLFKMGHKFFFNPDLVVFHERRSSLSEFWRQFLWYGYWSSRVFQKHPALFARTTGILPPATIVVFLLSVAVALSANIYTPLALTILALLAYEAVWSLKITFRRPDLWRNLLLTLLALPMRNTAIAFGFLAGMLCWLSHPRAS